MTDSEIAAAVRSAAKANSLIFALSKLIEIEQGKLTQFNMIKYFKAAFPEIPLRYIIEASASKSIVGPGGIDDGDFLQLLSPWLGRDEL